MGMNSYECKRFCQERAKSLGLSWDVVRDGSRTAAQVRLTTSDGSYLSPRIQGWQRAMVWMDAFITGKQFATQEAKP